MPTFQYHGPTPGKRPKFMVTPAGDRLELAPDGVSAPIDYHMVGHKEPGPKVEGRTFEVGEHVHAHENPDPELFKLVSED